MTLGAPFSSSGSRMRGREDSGTLSLQVMARPNKSRIKTRQSSSSGVVDYSLNLRDCIDKAAQDGVETRGEGT